MWATGIVQPVAEIGQFLGDLKSSQVTALFSDAAAKTITIPAGKVWQVLAIAFYDGTNNNYIQIWRITPPKETTAIIVEATAEVALRGRAVYNLGYFKTGTVFTWEHDAGGSSGSGSMSILYRELDTD